jgi:4-amino-4-deoxy-L-arabinose transferase-like glycosyltransferase
VDEMMSVQAAVPGRALAWSDILANYHGPLHAVVLHFWTGLFGLSETALRTPSLLAGLALVPVVYFLGVDLAGPGLGWRAAALLTVSPFHIWYSQECRNYAFAMLFGTLLGWCTWRLLSHRPHGDPPSAALWSAYGVAAVLGLYSNLDVLFLLGACFLALAVLHARRAFSRASIVTHVAIAAAFIPWLPAVFGWLDVGRLVGTEGATVPLRGATTLPALAVPYAFYVFTTGYSLGPSLRDLHIAAGWSTLRPWLWAVLPAACAFGLLAVRGAASLAAERTRRTVLAFWIVLPLLCVIFLAWRNLKVFNPRYASVSLAPVLFVVAEGSRRVPRAGAFGLLSVVCATCALSLWHLYTDARYAKDDLRAASRYLERNAGTGDAILVETIHLPLEYYYHGTVPYTVIHEEYREGSPLRALLVSSLRGKERAWLVSYPYAMTDPRGDIRAALSAWGRPVSRFAFAGGYVDRFDRGHAPEFSPDQGPHERVPPQRSRTSQVPPRQGIRDHSGRT